MNPHPSGQTLDDIAAPLGYHLGSAVTALWTAPYDLHTAERHLEAHIAIQDQRAWGKSTDEAITSSAFVNHGLLFFGTVDHEAFTDWAFVAVDVDPEHVAIREILQEDPACALAIVQALIAEQTLQPATAAEVLDVINAHIADGIPPADALRLAKVWSEG
jgi:hypothetical protein